MDASPVFMGSAQRLGRVYVGKAEPSQKNVVIPRASLFLRSCCKDAHA